MTENTDPAPEGEDDDAPVTRSDEDRAPTEYERELRKQARRYRDRAKDAETKAAEREAALKAEHAAVLADVQTKHDQRVIRAELRAAAIKAGITDASDLALLDVTGVRLDDKGDVVDAAKVIDTFKAAKPHLFTGSSTSSTASAPPATPPGAKHAREMTPDEYRAARAELTKRR